MVEPKGERTENNNKAVSTACQKYHFKVFIVRSYRHLCGSLIKDMEISLERGKY